MAFAGALLKAPILMASIALLVAVGAPARADGREALEGDLRALLAEERLSGAVYSTVVGGDVEVGAIGFSNAAARVPLRPDSKVHVGSVAKTVLALCVLRLVSERRLDLDAPVESLLPTIRFRNPWAGKSPVRLRHLLDHTSGLEDVRLWHMFGTATTPHLPLAAAFARDPGVLVSRTEPGSRFSYSNLGYTLAGMVIEATVGEPYERWAGREVLRPLGMTDSTFAFVSQLGDFADERLAWGHLDDLRPVAAHAIAVRPAGQFTTTADDMARLARFLMGDGYVAGKPFIQAELMRALGRPTTTEAARAGLHAGYGLGIATRDRHGAVGLCHDGSIIGYRALLCIFPRQQRAFFVAHNTDSETARYARFDERMIRHLGVSTATPPPSGDGLPSHWGGRYVPSPSRFESLALFDFLGSSWHVGTEPPSLTLAGGEPKELLGAGQGLYRLADRSEASHIFMKGADGERYASNGFRTMRRVSAARYLATWSGIALGLAGLAYWLLVAPARWIGYGASIRQPAVASVLLLLLPFPLLWLQGWATIGDLTLASGILYAATIALPALMLAQLAWSCRRRGTSPWWKAEIAATAFVLQLCALLYAWNLLPIALWR